MRKPLQFVIHLDVMPQPPKDLRQFQSLVELVRDLRGPQGCPWDKEQTHASLTPYLIEESAELAEAIESGDDQHMKEELGDTLFQIIIHAQLGAERGAFDISDVIGGIGHKIVRRHPHVFGDVKVSGTGDVLKNWDEIKAAEKAGKPSKLDAALDAPAHLPALQRSAKIGDRTRKLKFDWKTAEQVLEKVREEMAEMEEAIEEGNDHDIVHEIGDVLFSLAQLARHLDQDPEQILREANRRFEKRFAVMLETCKKAGRDWMTLTDDERENFWAQAKVQTAPLER